MSEGMTRADFLKMSVVLGMALAAPWIVEGQTVILGEPWIDEEAFEGAAQITGCIKTGIQATIDLKHAFSAMRYRDNQGRIWTVETGGDPNLCGDYHIRALVCGDMRIEV